MDITQKFTPLEGATTPSYYFDPAFFDKERLGLFSRLWIFAGLRHDLAKPNDYLRTEIAGKDIIVRNGAGQLRAFINSCSHRHARIHEIERGNHRLICPYHGWSYNDDGIPSGIPNRDEFTQVLANPASYALHQLPLQCAGQFVFVRIALDGPSLQEYLGPIYEFLVHVSSGLGTQMDAFRGTVHANWKVLIENALEGYHVPMVHRSTLGAIRQFSSHADDVIDHLPTSSGHSHMIHLANATWLRRWKGFEKELGIWPYRFEHYIHQLIFPNLTVTSFMGYSFHIQRFDPQSAGKTSVQSGIFSSTTTGQTAKGTSIMRKIYDESISFTHRVFGEDRRTCEIAYAGIKQAQSPTVLAARSERRVSHFQRAYLNLL